MKINYDNHRTEYTEYLKDPFQKLISDSWLTKQSLGDWRHARMYSLINPLIKGYEDKSWVTIGDGRYGTDANFLITSGIIKVHATDFYGDLLKIASSKGFIKNYSEENAEALSFKDESFDYVYCKEALHHFPRPFMALNEMIRVSKLAVILTEPRDKEIDKTFFTPIFNLLKLSFFKKNDVHKFESVGNYVYSISERELEKFILGMHYNLIAFRGCNDAYEPGIELVPFSSNKISHSFIKLKLKIKIKVLDILQYLKITKSGMIIAIIFKEIPSENVLQNLKDCGYEVKHLPKNPYLASKLKENE